MGVRFHSRTLGPDNFGRCRSVRLQVRARLRNGDETPRDAFSTRIEKTKRGIRVTVWPVAVQTGPEGWQPDI